MNIRNFFSNTPDCRKRSDEDLAEALRSGGGLRRRAMNCVFERFWHATGFAQKKYGLTDEETNIAFSDALVDFEEQIAEGRFEGRSGLLTFFTTIFHRRCIDVVRARTTEEESTDFSTLFAPGGPGKDFDAEGPGDPDDETAPGFLNPGLAEAPDHDILSREKEAERARFREGQKDCLNKAMNQIGERCRDLLADFRDGFDNEELAQIYGFKTPAVVASTIYNCKKNLRDAIERLCREDSHCARFLCQTPNQTAEMS